MNGLRYLSGVVSLAYDVEACVGCGSCTEVCPHGVFVLQGRKAQVVDRDACIECGACARNCVPGAIAVNPGTGCASLILQSWLHSWGLKTGDGCC